MLRVIKELLSSVNRHTLYFLILVFLTFFHIPLIWIEGDSIGLFDVYLVLYTIFVLSKRYRKYHERRLKLSKKWKEYYIVVLAYLCYMLLRNRIVEDILSLLIILKQIENMVLLFHVVTFFELRKTDTRFFISCFLIILFSLAFAQLSYVALGMLGIVRGSGWLAQNYGWFYRLGMPFMKGISSNPAGFVLGSIIIFYSEIAFKVSRRKIITGIAFAVVILALMLTISRTNIIALIFVFFVKLATGKNKVRALATTIGLFFLFFFIVLSVVEQDSVTGKQLSRMLDLLLNPALIFAKDQSFFYRYRYSWPPAWNAWLENGATVLFGKGVNYIPIVDGTLPRLLGNQGLVGAILFHYIWFVFFKLQFRKYRAVGFLLIFALINAINGETLLMSYRATQPYIVILIAAIFSTAYIKDNNLVVARRSAKPTALPVAV